MKACHVSPNQNIRTRRELYRRSSFDVKSVGRVFNICTDEPNNTFIQLLKNIVGPTRYNKNTRMRVNNGNKSKQKLKNKISAINMIDPGNPKNTRRFTRLTRNNFGHIKFTPLISVINRVLKRRPIASTSKNELVESKA